MIELKRKWRKRQHRRREKNSDGERKKVGKIIRSITAESEHKVFGAEMCSLRVVFAFVFIFIVYQQQQQQKQQQLSSVHFFLPFRKIESFRFRDRHTQNPYPSTCKQLPEHYSRCRLFSFHQYYEWAPFSAPSLSPPFRAARQLFSCFLIAIIFGVMVFSR